MRAPARQQVRRGLAVRPLGRFVRALLLLAAMPIFGVATAGEPEGAGARAGSAEWQRYRDAVDRAYSRWAENNTEEADRLLDECPEGLRGWEWRYVKRLCHLDLLTYRGHGRAVTSVAFSPDGKFVVSGAGGGFTSPKILQTTYGGLGEVAVWDAATGKEVFSHREIAGGVQSVAFSRDGKRVATGTTGGERL
jgi:hypothetical protein